MSDMVICDDRKAETDDLAKKAKDINAYLSETKLNIHKFTDDKECIEAVSGNVNADMAVTDVSGDGSTEVSEKVREENDDANIMIVADASVSPVRYLTPKIRACSLLLRPYSDEQCRRTLKDFMSDHYRRRKNDGGTIVVENRGEKIKVPVSRIHYVEVKGRKVFIRLRNTEYSEYASMEEILAQLGGGFIRCHRSFAFNKDFFESVKVSENIVKLSHGMSVPLSRSYKQAIKEFVNGCR